MAEWIEQGRPQLREIGGGKLKSGGQRFSPKSERFFWPKSQIFRPKAGDLKKKNLKVFAEIRTLFLAEITNFPPTNTNFFVPKKYRGGQEKIGGGGAKTKIGGALPPCSPRWRRAWDRASVTTETADSGSIPNRVKPDYKMWYSQLICLTFGN